MTQRPLDQLARADFATIPRYMPDAAAEINLADNTNLWGTPPAAAAVLRNGVSVSGYPDIYASSLKQTVATLAGIDASCVVTGNGSDDLLDCAIRSFAGRSDTVAHPDPTFVMLPVFARINDIRPIPVPLLADGSMDGPALLATGARIIYLCTPNNPTATPTPVDVVRHVIANAPGLVIVDEAYAEFSGTPGLLSEAPALGRVLVCRTLSKAYGLAGLRVGYGTASPEIVATIERSRGPYKVNAVAERAAVAALTLDRDWVLARAADAVAHRDHLAVALRALGLAPFASAANFLLIPNPRAQAIAAHAKTQGLELRAFAALPGIGAALRITVAPWPIMERVLTAIRESC